MYEGKDSRTGKIDYSAVTPATGTDPACVKVARSLANQMPTSDTPAMDGSPRTAPDKTIPGGEAASGVDQSEEERIQRETAKSG